MSKPVRVRFAPSPTGALHIGGIRTALFNYLFAKKHNGTFFLRIEDTDRTRFEPKAEKYIMNALDWLGISPSETVNKNEKFGPYRQSERQEIYKKYITELINLDHAYYAFDTSNSLENLRSEQEKAGKTFVYNHDNRLKLDNSLTITSIELQNRLAANEPFVVRFKNPTDETLYLQDMIRGDVQFKTALLDDKILYKSDGMPTYHFANIVDDHLMETSHVIRGEEWLPSLPLHYMLYRAFGWEAPQFAHLPLILKPIGNGKLSKRDGQKLGFPVFPLTWGSAEGYREQGFFPEAVINFLALLGWNDGTDKEIFTLLELQNTFDLTRVHKAGAKFDPEKNKWFNHQYMQLSNNEELSAAFSGVLVQKNIKISQQKTVKIVSLIKERATFISDFWALSSYLFEAPLAFDPKATKNWNTTTVDYLKKIITLLADTEYLESTQIELVVKEWISTNEINMGKIMQPLRICLVGSLYGIHIFDIIEIIGKEETINRIKYAIDTI